MGNQPTIPIHPYIHTIFSQTSVGCVGVFLLFFLVTFHESVSWIGWLGKNNTIFSLSTFMKTAFLYLEYLLQMHYYY